jgi:hypothetical protein
MRNPSIAWMGAVAASLALACSQSQLVCGTGTEQVGDECVVAQPNPDPLVGEWTPADGTHVTSCAFYSTGEWTCWWSDGWPSSWHRLDRDWYVFGVSNGTACDGRTTFSADESTVSIVLDCHGAFADGATVTLARVR